MSAGNVPLICLLCFALTIASNVRAQGEQPPTTGPGSVADGIREGFIGSAVGLLSNNLGPLLSYGVSSLNSLLTVGLGEAVNVLGTVLQTLSEDVIYGLFGSLIRIVFGLVQTLITGSIAQTLELVVGIIRFVQYEVPLMLFDIVAQVTQPLVDTLNFVRGA